VDQRVRSQRLFLGHRRSLLAIGSRADEKLLGALDDPRSEVSALRQAPQLFYRRLQKCCCTFTRAADLCKQLFAKRRSATAGDPGQKFFSGHSFPVRVAPLLRK